jgi:hypothetical protein
MLLALKDMQIYLLQQEDTVNSSRIETILQPIVIRESGEYLAR